MDKPMTKKDKRNQRLCILMSFLIPFLIMLLYMYLRRIEPFGEKTLLTGDASIQYYPVVLLQNRIVSLGESLLYSFRDGLGVNLMSIYIINPWHLLALLVPEKYVLLFLDLSVVVRMGLAGLTCMLMLKEMSGRVDLTAACFSALYPLCGWMMVSYWQLIWLDIIVLTPVVLAGLVRLVRVRDARLYIISLAVLLICEYSLAFSVCVMVGLVWIGLLIVLKKSLRELFGEVLRFLGSSLIAGALTAVRMIPAALGLFGLTSGDYTLDETSFKIFYSSFEEIVGQLCSFTYPRINSHPAMLATSILCVLLLTAFLVCRRIPLRERLYTVFLFLFLIFSLWYQPLNYVWHGFHFPHTTVDRFAFLVSLTGIYIGWRYTSAMHADAEEKQSYTKKQKVFAVLGRVLELLVMPTAALGVLYCAWVTEETDVVMIPLVLAGIYFLLYAVYSFVPKLRGIFCLMVSILMTAEVGYSSWHMINHMPAEDIIGPTPRLEQMIETVNAEQADAVFPARLGILYGEPMYSSVLMYDVPTASSVFSSSLPKNLKTFCGKLGMESSSDYYTIEYTPLLPISTELLNIPYAITYTKPMMFEEIASEQAIAGIGISEFSMPTAWGFTVPAQHTLEEIDCETVIETQQRLADLLTDGDNAIYERILPSQIRTKDLTLHDAGNGRYTFDAEEAGTGGKSVRPQIRFIYTVEEDGYYFVERTIKEFGDGILKRRDFIVDGQLVATGDCLNNANTIYSDTDPYAFGYLRRGQVIGVQYSLFAGDHNDAPDVRLCRLNEDAFRTVCETVMKEPLEITDYHQDTFSGTVTAEKDCVLYLSVPYDKGWRAEVDGQAAAVQPMFDAMIAVPLTAGTHHITMKFVPQGFYAGLIITAAAMLAYLIILILCTVSAHKRRKLAKLETAYAEADRARELAKQEEEETPKSDKAPAPSHFRDETDSPETDDHDGDTPPPSVYLGKHAADAADSDEED